MTGRFTLSEQENRRIYEKSIAPALQECESREKPKIIILAGQPGAGKSKLTAQAEREFDSRGGAVSIDIDALRSEHPDYNRLVRDTPRTAASEVQNDASAWGDRLLADARDQNKNIILDGTLKDPQKAETLVRDFKRSGYEVEVRAMAVSKETSELGVYERYENAMKNAPGAARWVPEDVRNDAYEGMPRAIDRLESQEDPEMRADRIRVYGRAPDAAGEPTCLHDSQAPSNVEKSASESIEAERGRVVELDEQKIRHDKWMEICEQIKTRDPYLEEPENRRAFELADREREAKDHLINMDETVYYSTDYECSAEEFERDRQSKLKDGAVSRDLDVSREADGPDKDGHSPER